jgi:hypothetical protein
MWRKMSGNLKKLFPIVIVGILFMQLVIPIQSIYGAEEEMSAPEDTLEQRKIEANEKNRAVTMMPDMSEIENSDSTEIQALEDDSEEFNVGLSSEDDNLIDPSNLGPNLFQNPDFNYTGFNGGHISNWEMIGTSTPVNVLNRNLTFTGRASDSATINTSDSRFQLGIDNINAQTVSVSARNRSADIGTFIISQTISTIPGRTYQVSGRFSGFRNSASGTDFGIMAYNGNAIVAGSSGLVNSLLFNLNNPDSAYFSWQNRSMEFTAIGNQTTISFRIGVDRAQGGAIQVPRVAEVDTLTIQASPPTGGNPTSQSAGAFTNIFANPNPGYRFVRWELVSGNGTFVSTTNQNTAFTQSSSQATIRAVYESIPQDLGLTLQASPAIGGNPTAETSRLVQGQTTNLTANPNEGYKFVRWEIISGTGSTIDSLTDPETVFTMGSQDTVVQAIYEENENQHGNLTLQASPATGGNPSAQSTSNPPGTPTGIFANTNPGYRFVRWELVSGSGTFLSTINENTVFTQSSSQATIRAVYESIPQDLGLTLQASPTIGGNPTAETSRLVQGQTTNLTANPNEGYKFVRWELVSGEDSTISSLTELETVFTMGSQDAVVRAVYEENQPGEVHVHHVDLNGHELTPMEIIEGSVGEDYQTEPKEIDHYQIEEIPENANGVFTEDLIIVTYIYKATTVSPVDPTDPETEVEPDNKPEIPDNQELLSIDFVSQFRFGIQVISAQDETYYALPQTIFNEMEERPNYVQISDRRSENERHGWQLAVTQIQQFITSEGKELAGAQLSLSNQQLATAQGGTTPTLQVPNPVALVPGNKRVLVQAKGDEGRGTWIYRFGDKENAAESVSLTVPQGSNPEATSYSSRLVWELSAIPGNE